MIELSMFITQQLFLGNEIKVLLRVKMEIEKQSTGYNKVAHLKVVSKQSSEEVAGTVVKEQVVFGCTEVIDFGLSAKDFHISSGEEPNSSILQVIYEQGSGTAPLVIRNIEVYTQKAIPVSGVSNAILKTAKKDGIDFDISGLQSGLFPWYGNQVTLFEPVVT